MNYWFLSKHLLFSISCFWICCFLCLEYLFLPRPHGDILLVKLDYLKFLNKACTCFHYHTEELFVRATQEIFRFFFFLLEFHAIVRLCYSLTISDPDFVKFHVNLHIAPNKYANDLFLVENITQKAILYCHENIHLVSIDILYRRHFIISFFTFFKNMVSYSFWNTFAIHTLKFLLSSVLSLLSAFSFPVCKSKELLFLLGLIHCC